MLREPPRCEETRPPSHKIMNTSSFATLVPSRKRPLLMFWVPISLGMVWIKCWPKRPKETGKMTALFHLRLAQGNRRHSESLLARPD